MLAALVGLAAVLYSAVGHGGASGYLASMALFGMAPAVMRPTALVMNLLVAGVGTVRFGRAGHLHFRLFWPFAAASVPAAFLGGLIEIPATTYRLVLAATLLFAAGRMVMRLDREVGHEPPAIALSLVVGAVLGFVSGLVGVGGGIFLSPVLLLAGWAGLRETAATSAAFILVNSAAGLAGQYANLGRVPASAPLLAAVALAGGLVGSSLGANRLPLRTLRWILAVVLLAAAIKLAVS